MASLATLLGPGLSRTDVGEPLERETETSGKGSNSGCEIKVRALSDEQLFSGELLLEESNAGS